MSKEKSARENNTRKSLTTRQISAFIQTLQNIILRKTNSLMRIIQLPELRNRYEVKRLKCAILRISIFEMILSRN